MEKNLKRSIQQIFRVDESELDLIREKMQNAKISNKEAYYRKMVLDGYVVRLDFSDIRKMVTLLSNSTNNLNQIARRINETHNIYESDIKDLQDNYEKLWVQAEEIMKKLANINP